MHSPFHVIEDLISPLRCEQLIKELGLLKPSLDEDGRPLKYERLLPPAELTMIRGALAPHRQAIEERYGSRVLDWNGMFQQYWEDPKKPAEPIGAQGWMYSRKKWHKVRDIDLVGFLWLKDFNSSVPLDPRFEVYGAKLEFPAYDFSLTPVRGMAVFFPATPHFVHALSHVMFGSMEQILLTTKLTTPEGAAWSYDPMSFPGTYQEWFLAEV
jgi:hypothetical protein